MNIINIVNEKGLEQLMKSKISNKQDVLRFKEAEIQLKIEMENQIEIF